MLRLKPNAIDDFVRRVRKITSQQSVLRAVEFLILDLAQFGAAIEQRARKHQIVAELNPPLVHEKERRGYIIPCSTRCCQSPQRLAMPNGLASLKLPRCRPARGMLPFSAGPFLSDLRPEHCQQRGDDQASEDCQRRDDVPAAVVPVAHQAAPQPSGGRLELQREGVQQPDAEEIVLLGG